MTIIAPRQNKSNHHNAPRHNKTVLLWHLSCLSKTNQTTTTLPVTIKPFYYYADGASPKLVTHRHNSGRHNKTALLWRWSCFAKAGDTATTVTPPQQWHHHNNARHNKTVLLWRWSFFTKATETAAALTVTIKRVYYDTGCASAKLIKPPHRCPSQ